MDAIILAGGKGTRLREVVSDRPKPLAEINGRPFLDYLLEYLEEQNLFSRVILSVGYLGEQIKNTYSTIECVQEEIPLGTGGAIKACLQSALTDTVFVCNGDSFLAADLQEAASFHKTHRGAGTIITRWVDDVSRYGSLEIDEKGRICTFLEKGKEGAGHINAGMYFFDREKFLQMPFKEVFSIEVDGFPLLLKKGLFSFSSEKAFIDIGTKESYHFAKQFFNGD